MDEETGTGVGVGEGVGLLEAAESPVSSCMVAGLSDRLSFVLLS